MRHSEAAHYARRLRALGDRRRLEAVRDAVLALMDSLDSGQRPPIGLGLKLLRPSLWEIRSTLKDRVIFLWDGGTITFLAVGTHDEIRRFLRTR